MKRKLYNLCTLASLLLLCGSLWWWNHTSRHTDQVTLHGVGGASVQVTGSGGQVTFTKAVSTANGGGELSWKSSAKGGEATLLATSFTFNNHPQNGMTLVLPSWALALVFAVFPSLWVYSKLHSKGKKKPDAH